MCECRHAKVGWNVTQVVLLVFVLTAIYAFVIVLLARILRGFRIANGRAVFAACLIFGLATGILVVLLWPSDSCFLPNILGIWLGDWIYIQAIAWIGDPYSDHANETIPWLFRVPQVYAIASIAWCAAAGWLLEWFLGQHFIRRSHPQ